MEETQHQKSDVETVEKQEVGAEEAVHEEKSEKKHDKKALYIIIILLIVLLCAAIVAVIILVSGKDTADNGNTTVKPTTIVESTSAPDATQMPTAEVTATAEVSPTPGTKAHTFQLAMTAPISKDKADFALDLPVGSTIKLSKMQGWDTNNIADINAPNFDMQISIFYEAEPTHFDSYLYISSHPQFGRVDRVRASQTIYYTNELSKDSCFAGSIEAPCGPPVLTVGPAGQFFFATCDAEQQYKTECDAVISSLRVTWHELD